MICFIKYKKSSILNSRSFTNVRTKERGYWENKDNRLKHVQVGLVVGIYLRKWLELELGIKKNNDWYRITVKELNSIGNASMLRNIFNNSLYSMLKSVYPEHDWCAWKFNRVHQKYWESIENKKSYMDWIKKELNIRTEEDWYKITQKHFRDNYGGSLISMYKGSPYLLLKEVYPHNKWIPWKFKKVYSNFWKDKKNQKDYIIWLGEVLNYNEESDWYNVTQEEFKSNYGNTLLQMYKGSPYFILKEHYPNFDWKSWRFLRTPKAYVDSELNLKEFVEYLETIMDINSKEDWYRVSIRQIEKHSASGYLKKYGSLYSILTRVFPEYPWNKSLLQRKSKKSSQRWLKISLQKLYPDCEILEDFQFKNHNISIEFDVWIPQKNMAFEYQGEQHYFDIPLMSTKDSYLIWDKRKREICISEGITLIDVPYWWDGSTQSLKSIINKEGAMYKYSNNFEDN